MSDVLDASYEEPVKKRPVFLTVLCILTFVSCGLTFVSSLFGLFAQNSLERMQRVQARQMNDADMPEMFSRMQEGMEKMQEWTTFSHYMGLANVLICFAGAMLMWRLRKPGYFIYIFGQVLPFIPLVGMYSAVQSYPLLGFAAIIGGVLAAIFSIAFIIMYGLNVKHMR